MWQHPLRQRLRDGDIIVGMTVVTSNVEAAAHAAGLGFHFLWIEMEHSPVSLEALRLIVLATAKSPAAVLARVPYTELWMAKRVLDQGVSGVIFPFVSSSTLAQRAADACYYPPKGLRGSGAGLASATWPAPGSYYDSADENILSIAVIENVEGVENIEEITATSELDIIFIGTADLSFSLGCRGDQNAPAVKEAVAKIVLAARKHGKYLGRPAGTAKQIQEWRTDGFQVFQTGTELGLMSAGASQLLEPLGITGIPKEQRALY